VIHETASMHPRSPPPFHAVRRHPLTIFEGALGEAHDDHDGEKHGHPDARQHAHEQQHRSHHTPNGAGVGTLHAHVIRVGVEAGRAGGAPRAALLVPLSTQRAAQRARVLQAAQQGRRLARHDDTQPGRRHEETRLAPHHVRARAHATRLRGTEEGGKAASTRARVATPSVALTGQGRQSSAAPNAHRRRSGCVRLVHTPVLGSGKSPARAETDERRWRVGGWGRGGGEGEACPMNERRWVTRPNGTRPEGYAPRRFPAVCHAPRPH
jgi:hypothetical protein